MPRLQLLRVAERVQLSPIGIDTRINDVGHESPLSRVYRSSVISVDTGRTGVGNHA